VNLTKRRKVFCNNTCASRFIALQKREELKKDRKKYEAFLKESRKYQRERYEKMRRAQLGPNVMVGRKMD
jgi:hypothetical protein